jgi:exodeoxyribonuclease V alpha subunit
MPGDPTDAGGGERSGEPHGERVGEVWDALRRRGQIRIYASDAERTQALAQLAADTVHSGHAGGRGPGGMLMMADTREATAVLNGAIRDRLLAAGHLDATHTVVTTTGERLGVGDRVATRRNDRDLGVTNRDTWTITAIGADGVEGSLTLRGRRATDVRTVPAGYAREHVELAYATTVYGAQGETAGTGHLMVGEHTSAASAYVAMTRGRDNNVAHLVADDAEDARRLWEEVFGRDRADLGPAAAAERAAEDIERYGTQAPTRPLGEVVGDLWAAWTRQADLHEQHRRLVGERDALQQVAAIQARYTPGAERLRGDEVDARSRWSDARQRVLDLEAAMMSETADLQTRVWGTWRQELAHAQRAAEVVGEGAGRLGQRRRQVRDASAELTAFAARWRPAVPDLATDPAELATQVTWLHGRRRVEDPINAFIGREVAGAHPDADQIREAERVAYLAYERAERSRTHLDEAMYAELRPYGQAAHTRDVSGRLAAVVDQLAGVQLDLHTATARVDVLTSEPTVRALPGGGPEGEHERWSADRVARQGATSRQAKDRRQRQQETRRIEPPPPSRRTPDHGRGIGR